MSQNDFNLANQGFPSMRADINSALQALASNSSGTTAPATPYANQFWYETDTNILYIRDEANTAWLALMVIDGTTGSPSFNSGNVGIGDTSPDKKLVVYSSSSPDAMVLSHPTATTDTQGATLLFRNETSSSSLSGAEIGYRTGSAIDRGSLVFSTSTASNVPTEKVRIDSAGNVGIGTAAPATALDVVGQASFGDGTALLPSITNTGDTNTGIFFPAADTIAFSEGGAEAMRIDNAGNVGIGTTSPTNTLTVNGTVGGTIIATQAEAEAGTSSTKLMTPQRVKQAIDALATVNATINANGTIARADGIASVSRTAAGSYTHTFTTARADANYALVGSPKTATAVPRTMTFNNVTTSGFSVLIRDGSNVGTDTDHSIVVVG
jgi:hypothetical protein